MRTKICTFFSVDDSKVQVWRISSHERADLNYDVVASGISFKGQSSRQFGSVHEAVRYAARLCGYFLFPNVPERAMEEIRPPLENPLENVDLLNKPWSTSWLKSKKPPILEGPRDAPRQER